MQTYISCNVKHTLPNILLFNARSLFNKIDELTIIINQQNADVIMVTETLLIRMLFPMRPYIFLILP